MGPSGAIVRRPHEYKGTVAEVIDELVAAGFSREHLIDRPIEEGFDPTLEGVWEVRWGRHPKTWVVNAHSNVYAHDEGGPLVHDLECATLKGVAPCAERYRDRQVHQLFWADAKHRAETGRTLVGWCQRCAVQRVR